MIRNIIVTDTAIYANHRLPCLNSRQQKLYVVKLDDSINDIDERAEIFDINKYIPDNVLVLGDLNVDSLLVLKQLQKSSDIKYIHLILPLPFGKMIKGTPLYDILSDFNKIRTLAIYDPYKLAKQKYGDTDIHSVEKIIDEQTEYLMKRLTKIDLKLAYQADKSKYFYEPIADRYIETDSLEILDDYKITTTIGFLINPDFLYRNKEENDYTIQCMQAPVPRPDGKQICNKLRSIRKEFAKLNNIDFEFKECTYHGPCAGTCKFCDQEAKTLYDLAEKNGAIQYPKVLLEE